MGERSRAWVDEGREFLRFRRGESLDLGDFGVVSPTSWSVWADRITAAGDIEMLGLVGRSEDPEDALPMVEEWLRANGYWGDTAATMPWVLLDGDYGPELGGS